MHPAAKSPGSQAWRAGCFWHFDVLSAGVGARKISPPTGFVLAGGGPPPPFIGGVVADKMSRMMAYALAGALAAVFGVWLAVGPATAFTYGAGYAGYSIAAGFAYAVYTAFLLDVVGKRQHAAAFAYSVLNAS